MRSNVKTSDADTAPKGSVAIQASRISRTLLQLASPLRSNPIPKIPPDVTCVVDTGSANGEARVTRVAATKLAVTASRVAIGVIFLLIVRATRAAPSAPPIAIATAMAR